ncbi:actin-like ATPase domain-containing protein [Aspergillus steynii IBT 23096]|uniref:Actin-like ATPase domain-containing protein n=1 Tax=Aspergillus steynii IBT 23096 TaxID=1392250 RepID=A0A2I2GHY1_9EURO|nr:actin-like ATPase domain-containing protein [Aspergillus steynii IBT 23096]PLB52486.1 actin-like ATPase domain-containing protein [Aspergillus steynii IBT 23096]
MAQHGKIIVGVDYGTTGSTFSYFLPDRRNSMNPREYHNWPGPGHGSHVVSEKAPSILAYPEENPYLRRTQWGHEVTPEMKSVSWTKLMVDKNTTPQHIKHPSLDESNSTGVMRIPRRKTPQQVVSDYLQLLYMFICSTLQQKLEVETLDGFHLEFRFAVPAVWGEDAKDLFFGAVRGAGFTSRIGASQVEHSCQILREPEVVMAKVLTYRAHLPTQSVLVQAGDGVVVCDIGGGTVDITSYNISSVRPRISYDQLTEYTGGLCGATAVDRNFHQYLQGIFGESFQSIPLVERTPGSAFMSAFEDAKHSFSSHVPRPHRLPIRIPFSATDPQVYDQHRGELILAHHTLRSFFQPVVRAICLLLHQQIIAANAKAGDFKINRIILAGGLSQSQYLISEVRTVFGQTGRVTVDVIPEPIMAVADGGACWGIGAPHPVGYLCQRHYGVPSAVPFVSGLHDEDDAHYDIITGQKMAHGIEWKQSYDEGYVGRHEVTFPFHEDGTLLQNVDIFSSDLNTPPFRTAVQGAKHLSQLCCDLSQVNLSQFPHSMVNGRVSYNVSLTIVFRVKSSNRTVQFEGFVGSQSLGSLNLLAS